MIKVMLVDDEKIVREDLSSLIEWEKEGFDLVGIAVNGRAALDIFKSRHPDIVITDIRMPVMDGIELSRQLVDLNRNVIIVLLTAYQDSEYAIQAVNLGIKRYLLKYSLNADRLVYELNSIRKEIRERQQNSRLIHQRTFCDALDVREEAALASNLRSLGISLSNTEYCIAAASFDAFHHGTEEGPGEKYVLLKRLLEGEVRHAFSPDKDYLLLEKQHNRFIILYHSQREYGMLQSRQRMKRLFMDLCYSFRSISGETVSIGISDLFYDYRQIPFYYKQSVKYLKYSFFTGKNSVLDRESDVFNRSGRENSDLYLQMGTLLGFLEDGHFRKEQEIWCCLREIFLSRETEEDVKAAGFEILNAIRIYLDEKKIGCREIFEDGTIPIYRLEGLRDMNSYLEWFGDIFKRIGARAARGQGRSYSRKIQNAIEFMTRNYHRNIRLEDVAGELEISKEYLCSLFKKETGESFVGFLTQVRIEQAKKLLRKTDKKILEIAMDTGFESLHYFSRIFKKVAGQSPAEYRNSDLH